MEGHHFLEVPGLPGYSVPGTSYSVPSTNYEVPPTQSIVPAYETAVSLNMAASMPFGGTTYSAPSTRYDVPGSNPCPVMAAPSAELTPASTFVTSYTVSTNEVPSMTYAAPAVESCSSFQPASPEPITTGAFLANNPELGLDATARAMSPAEPLVGYGTPPRTVTMATMATTPPARSSETPTTMVGRANTGYPWLSGFIPQNWSHFFTRDQ